MGFAINVTNFNGNAEYNYPYGITEPVPVPPFSYSYPPANNITLTTVNFPSWTSNPLQLPPSGSNNSIYNFSGF